jgi:hypothetical protein
MTRAYAVKRSAPWLAARALTMLTAAAAGLALAACVQRPTNRPG